MENRSSFILDNIGGLIFAVVLVVIGDISAFGAIESGHFLYILSNIIQIPLVFLGFLGGKKIRDFVHPSFIVANGFWGLLKEKIFWKIGPQTIGAVIVFAIAMNTTKGLVYNPEREAAENIEERRQTALQEQGNSTQTAQNIPQFAEQITREEFIEKYAGGNEIIETDADRAATMVRRGSRYLKVTGAMTVENLSALNQAIGDIKYDSNSSEGLIYLSTVPNLNTIKILRSLGDPVRLGFFDTVVLGDNVTEIPAISCKHIYIPPTAQKILGGAFSLTPLEEIIIPASVKEIGRAAFHNCTNLTTVYFSKNSQLETIKFDTFENCENLVRLDIPDSVKVIESGAFSYCTRLEQVNFSKTSRLEILEEGGAFGGTGIVQLYLPATIKEIGGLGGMPLAVLTIAAPTPPKVVNGYMMPESVEKIYVPAESLKLYEDAWFDYKFTFNNQLTGMENLNMSADEYREWEKLRNESEQAEIQASKKTDEEALNNGIVDSHMSDNLSNNGTMGVPQTVDISVIEEKSVSKGGNIPDKVVEECKIAIATGKPISEDAQKTLDYVFGLKLITPVAGKDKTELLKAIYE
jgi:hypothetical protein